MPALYRSDMSCNEWEDGTLVLPNAAVTGLKRTLIKATNAHRDAVLALCHRFWEQHKTRSVARYRERVDEFIYPPQQSYQSYRRNSDEQLRTDAYHLLEMLAEHPRKAIQSDLDKAGIVKATNRTSCFRVGLEASITLKGRNLGWHVPENNHACERAREHPLAQALFTALEKISWTRGTGGVILGNNEYAREAEHAYAGGGGSYIVSAFGPRGEEARAQQMGISVAKYRTMMRQSRVGRYGRSYGRAYGSYRR